MNPLLEYRRRDTAPKCANCGWFTVGTGTGCLPSAGHCGRHSMTVLDLAVCTEHRDNEPVQDILPPERDE